jgi:glycosidase
MPNPTRALPLLIALLFASLSVTCWSSAYAADQRAGKPVITKVDPPNWWLNLPNPMLLLHGANLQGASVTVQPRSVSVMRTKVSANGHWLFVWLDTKQASAGVLHLRVKNAVGATSVDFPLAVRKPASAGFQGFSSRDVMYLIMTDRFADGDTSNDSPANGSAPQDRGKPRGWHGGDLRGIQDHLGYLKQLGITTIWTTPVYDNGDTPESYHGYGAVDMYGIDPHFGTLQDYQRMVNAAHALGLKVVLDTVPNHVGPRSPWVKDPPTPDWFHGTLAHHFAAEGDFRAIPNPHSTPLARHAVTQGWFANTLPDLNQENPLVAQYLIQNAMWWVESASLDGLRLDTFPFVDRAFWQQFHSELHAVFPQLTTVGEIFNKNPVITSYFAGGVAHRGVDTGLYTPFDFPTMFALRSVLINNSPASDLNDVLGDDWLYPHPERLVVFEGNHDTTRFLSEPGATPQELKLAFAVLATTRGMVQIYSGDEIAMHGGEDPDNRHDFPGGFSGDAHNAFTAAGRTPTQQSMFAWASALFQFRQAHPVLQTGQLQTVYADKADLAYLRAADVSHGCTSSGAGKKPQGERLLVLLNTTTASTTFTIPTHQTALAGCSQFTYALGDKAELQMQGETLHVTIQPQQAAIYSVQ